MKDFNRGGGFSGRKGGNDRRGGDNFSRPTMHQATCAQCGQSCEVPFRPSGDKPVYCSNCFKGKDNSSPRQSGGRDFAKSNFNDKRLFKAVCDKCGQSCEVPFQPLSGKPVYCSNCFSRGDNANSSNSHNHGDSNKGSHGNSSSEQLEILNVKLDKILRVLNSLSGGESAVKIDKDEKIESSESQKNSKKLSKKIVASKIKVAKKNKKK